MYQRLRDGAGHIVYSKSRLNEAYLDERARETIEEGLPNLGILPCAEQ